jgi:hypothetical protein
VFEHEGAWMPLVAVAIQREMYRLFNEAGMMQVGDNPEISIFFLCGTMQFRFDLPNVRTEPLDLVDVEVTGRYSTLAENSPSRPLAKAPGYAEQVIYSVAALIADPTGNTKL